MLPQNSAGSAAPREVVAVEAVLELQKAFKPQRLSQILGSLHFLLAFSTETQDYHFLVDPIDRTTLTGRRVGQLEQLINQNVNGTIRVHYTPETGVMTVATMSRSLERALLLQVLLSVKENIAAVPDFELRSVHDFDVSQYLCCIDYKNKPYGLFLLANPGATDMAAMSIGSALSDVTRNHHSIELVVRLELGGLDGKIRDTHHDGIESRVRRVAEKSRIGVWVRKNGKFVHDKPSSSDNLHEGGELRLRLLGENAQGYIVSLIKFSGILDVIRDHGKKGVALTGLPGNEAAGQASAFHLQAVNMGGGSLATRGIRAGRALIKPGGSGRLFHHTATRATGSLTSILPACRLLGRLVRR